MVSDLTDNSWLKILALVALMADEGEGGGGPPAEQVCLDRHLMGCENIRDNPRP